MQVSKCGSVTFIQRFRSALNVTTDFHTLVLDGIHVGPSHSPGVLAASASAPWPSTSVNPKSHDAEALGHVVLGHEPEDR